jgi:hypothetical protein
MLSMANKNMPVLYCLLLFLSLVDQSVSNGSGIRQGFTDIAHFRGRFLAVGTDGRIDCISPSGERVAVDRSNQDKLNCVFSNGELLIAAGDHGTILYSSDGKNFYRAESGTDQCIHGIASQNGLILAGAENGTLIISKDGKSWSGVQTSAKGNILSLSSNHFFFIGITDAGEIMKSLDGMTWEIQDYNQEYAGYNPHSKFKKVLATQYTIVIIGTHEDGSPSILFSSLGNVWAERFPIYHDDGMICSLTSEPNGIAYDSGGDQFILACDQGELLSLPACTKCNEYKKISENNLNAIIYLDDRLVIVGDEFSVFVQRL